MHNGFGKRWVSELKKYLRIFSPEIILVISLVMLWAFPRERNVESATLFAVAFWLSLIICIFKWVAIVKKMKEIEQRDKH